MSYQHSDQGNPEIPVDSSQPEFQPRLSGQHANNVYNPKFFALTGLLLGPPAVAAVALMNLRALPSRVSSPTILISALSVGLLLVALIVSPSQWWAELPRLSRYASQAAGGITGLGLARIQRGPAVFASGTTKEFKSIWSLWWLLLPVTLVYAVAITVIMAQRGLFELS